MKSEFPKYAFTPPLKTTAHVKSTSEPLDHVNCIPNLITK